MAAAYAAIVSLNFLIDQIQHSALHYKPHFQLLQENITFLQEFLENHYHTQTQTSSQDIQELETRIRDVGRAAGDAIESHVLGQNQNLLKSGDTSTVENLFPENLQKLMMELDSIKEKAMTMKIMGGRVVVEVEDEKPKSSSLGGGQSGSTPATAVSNIIVGFDEHVIDVMGRISGSESSLHILPIVGMGGIGKTTLARSVYENKFIKEHFHICLWISISQSYNVQDIFLSLLHDLRILYKVNPEDISSITESSPECSNDLGHKLYKALSGRNYLVVMDDIWSADFWYEVRRFFPDNGNGSRIIITTRLLPVASCIGSFQPYVMQFLNKEEGWTLFKDIVFAKDGCRSELVGVGRKIVASCKGLPIAIVVIGGLLAKSNMRKEYWESVAGALSSIVNSDNAEYCLKVLSLSYENLPIHLKPCFLYMGVFREGSEIRISNLVKSLVAEGFLKPGGAKSLEDDAVEYLSDLVERNLILVSKRESGGRLKSIRIHDLLRDLCLREAQKQDFLCTRRFHALPNPAHTENKPHTDMYHTIREESHPKILHPSRSISLGFSAFESLSEADFSDKDSDQNHCLLLGSRSLTLSDYWNMNASTCSASLVSLSKLWNLQSLIMCELLRNSPVILPPGIWDMPLLRHLEIQQVILPDPPNAQANVLENLQTLLHVHDFKFSEDVVKRIPNLKKLKIAYWESAEGMESAYCLNNLYQLHMLESLSCSMYGNISLEHVTFPLSLKRLSLDGGQSPWELMTKVGSLPNLEELKLKNHAFYGEEWQPIEDQFCKLKSLHLRKINLERWVADSIHFPRLEKLMLYDVQRMEEIPPGIGDIATLELISIEFCSTSLAKSAEQLLKDQEENTGNTYTKLHVKLQDHRSPDLINPAAAVEFLLENLKQLLLDHAQLISNTRDQVVKLEEDLRLFKAFLKDTTKKRRKDEKLSELVRQIRDVVYEAEDIVDTFVTMAAEAKSMNYFQKLYKKPVNLLKIAKDVAAVGETILAIYGDKSRVNFAILAVEDEGYQKDVADEDPENNKKKLTWQDPIIVTQKKVVGFEDEAVKIIGCLKEETQQLDVISITGMPGLGKSTLAGKIFRDPIIQCEFPTRVWVYISQEFTRRNVFLAILKEFTKVTDEMINEIDDQELARVVATYLTVGKFLIVMDEIWRPEDWDELKIALPVTNNMGKVLITTRNNHVAWNANSRNRAPHQLRFLTEKEGMLLLQSTVSGKLEFTRELEHYGRDIILKCGMLPLAIVVVGEILAKKVCAAEDASVMWTIWTQVAGDLNTHIFAEDTTDRLGNTIALSYNALPSHLRSCFLYMGMFPEGAEIPAHKLICMWIAEGFVQYQDGFNFEETAENYMHDLFNWNLLGAVKRRWDGKVKKCSVHNIVLYFCKKEAGEDNFLQEMKWSRLGGFDPPTAQVEESRRLCIHSNVWNFVSSRPFGPRVRSFVCFSHEEINLTSENNSSIPAAFKLLRVLEAKPIRFSKLPSDMYHLVHLRYIAMTFCSTIIPAAFSRLWSMQTLVVDTTQRLLDIKADIWKMKQFRHLKTNASTILPKPRRGTTDSENIQTLGTISPISCTEGVFGRARFVKKLGIRGRLSLLLEGNNGSFDGLGKLKYLEKLKMINDVFPSSASEDPLPGLPSPYQFPPKLKSLTLVATFLDWNKMSIIGHLENLEVLKLKDNAFVGKTWEVTGGGFRKLEVLYIGHTDLVIWMARKHHFPRLRSLELRNCEDLQQLPAELADIVSRH